MSHANSHLGSPFSDEHYRTIAKVSADLTTIINRTNTSSYATKAAVDALSQLTNAIVNGYVPDGTNASHPIDNA